MDIKLGVYNCEWGLIGGQLSKLNYPEYVDAEGRFIVVSERDNHRVQVFDNYGNVSNFKTMGQQGSGHNRLLNPAGVITTHVPHADILVADTGNRRVNYYGIHTDQHGYGEITQTNTFGGLLFQKPMGLLYSPRYGVTVVTDPGLHRLTFHDFTNQQLLRAVDEKTSGACLRAPLDATVDQMGRIFVTDHDSDCVFCFDGNGKHLFTFGKGELFQPWGICFDRRKQFLYVSDKGKDRVVKYSPSGVFVKEVVRMSRPKGMSVNAHGNLIVTTEDPLCFVKLVGFQTLQGN